MSVSLLRLHQFRCHDYLSLDIDPKAPFVFVTGPNGSGKTSLLEALSLFCQGKGLRGTPFPDMIKSASAPDSSFNDGLKPDSGFHIILHINTTIPLELETSFVPNSNRINKIQGKIVKGSSSFREHMNVVWLTPDLDRLFLLPPETRRRFLDRLIYTTDAAYANCVREYDHYRFERLKTLRDHPDLSWVTLLEKNMAMSGSKIVSSRHRFLKNLELARQEKASFLTLFKSELVSEVDTFFMTNPNEDHLFSFLVDSFQKRRSRDTESGTTSIGPHRSDFQLISLKTGRKANSCSYGEQKVLLLSFFMAFLETLSQQLSTPFLLLLDDIFSHLDTDHEELLLKELMGFDNIQTWMSGARMGPLEFPFQTVTL